MKVPDWVLELGSEIRDQDNLATNQPAWQVRHERLIPCPDDMDPDGWLHVSEDRMESWGFVSSSEQEPEPEDGSTVEPVWKIEEVVQTFLTRKAAEAYIEENRHNLENPLVFAASLYRNREMIRLRSWLVELADAAEDGGGSDG